MLHGIAIINEIASDFNLAKINLGNPCLTDIERYLSIEFSNKNRIIQKRIRLKFYQVKNKDPDMEKTCFLTTFIANKNR